MLLLAMFWVISFQDDHRSNHSKSKNYYNTVSFTNIDLKVEEIVAETDPEQNLFANKLYSLNLKCYH